MKFVNIKNNSIKYSKENKIKIYKKYKILLFFFKNTFLEKCRQAQKEDLWVQGHQEP